MVVPVTINLDQVITEVVKYIGYVATVFIVAWKLSQRITTIEQDIKHISKMFDLLWEERRGKGD